MKTLAYKFKEIMEDLEKQLQNEVPSRNLKKIREKNGQTK